MLEFPPELPWGPSSIYTTTAGIICLLSTCRVYSKLERHLPWPVLSLETQEGAGALATEQVSLCV